MDSDISLKWSLPTKGMLLLALVAVGLCGNYFRYPIFLNIDFLFGSIFAMLALQTLGTASGLVAAALIASITYALWNHPYAIAIMVLEVVWVAWLTRRRNTGPVLADALYWLCVGMPLVYIFYHGIMDVPLGNTTIVMTKQAVNGIVNTLLARLIFSGWMLSTGAGRITYRDLVYNLLAFFALAPALTLLMLAGHRDFLETDYNIRAEMLAKSRLMSQRLNVWVQDRTPAIVNLAAMAATLPRQQMQTRLEQAHAADPSFLRIGLLDKDATTVAYSPATDELGHSNFGKNFADRPFLENLQQTLRPMLSEVVIGKLGTPRPIVTLLSPVVVHGTYAGYVSATLSLVQVQDYLATSAAGDAMLYTLLDRNRNIIMTNRTGQEIMTPLVRGSGTLTPIDTTISQWLPTVPANTPVSERWRSSFYVTEAAVGSVSEWQLVLEVPVAPFQKTLYARYTGRLSILLGMLLGALALAEVLSRKVAYRTEQLSVFTEQLPQDLGMGKQPDWPQSNLTEHHQLISKFQAMAGALAAQFEANRQLTGTLEERVARRTAALANSEEKYRLLVENSHDIIYTLDVHGTFTYVSKAWTALLGHLVSEVVGHPFMPFVHPDDLGRCMAAMEEVFQAGQPQHEVEYRVRHVDGTWRWHTSNSVPLRDEVGQVVGFEGIASDITERKRMDGQVRQLAFYDALTQLPNRRLLSDRMGQAMAASKRNACYGALMFLDLDNFKPLNDRHGHAAGDLLLIEVAHRLLGCVREVDTVARFGGDEFVVMLGDLGKEEAESAAQARLIAEKIRTSLAQPYLLTVDSEGAMDRVIEHRCSASIGVVVFVNHEVDPQDVLKWADAAMYRAKDAGRNAIHFHDEATPSA